mgnify:CR=1 FL=1
MVSQLSCRIDAPLAARFVLIPPKQLRIIRDLFSLGT